MQRTLASVNPVLRKRASKVSIAFEIMQVLNLRRASRSSSVSKDAAATFVSFHRTKPQDVPLARAN
jgi:hypothetical protein